MHSKSCPNICWELLIVTLTFPFLVMHGNLGTECEIKNPFYDEMSYAPKAFEWALSAENFISLQLLSSPWSLQAIISIYF